MSAEGQRFGRTHGRAPITRVETPLDVYYLDPVTGPCRLGPQSTERLTHAEQAQERILLFGPMRPATDAIVSEHLDRAAEIERVAREWWRRKASAECAAGQWMREVKDEHTDAMMGASPDYEFARAEQRPGELTAERQELYAAFADTIKQEQQRTKQAEADLATLRAAHAKCWKLPPPDTDPVLEAALTDAVRLRAGIAALEQDIRAQVYDRYVHEDSVLTSYADRLAALRDGRG